MRRDTLGSVDLWLGNPNYGEDAGRSVLSAHLFHLHFADGFGIDEGRLGAEESLGGIKSYGLEIRAEQFFNHLSTFHDEEAQLFAELLLA